MRIIRDDAREQSGLVKEVNMFIIGQDGATVSDNIISRPVYLSNVARDVTSGPPTTVPRLVRNLLLHNPMTADAGPVNEIVTRARKCPKK